MGSSLSSASTPDTSLSEYELLAQRREWARIVRVAEEHLAEEKPIEAQLWWIRGHLGGFSMPVTLLAGPMEALCRGAVIHELPESLRRVLVETSSLTLGRLEEVGQRDQCESLEAAMSLAGIKAQRGVDGRTRKGTSSFRASDFAIETIEPSSPAPQVVEAPPSTRRGYAIGGAIVIGLLAGMWFFDPFKIFTDSLDTVRESFVIDTSAVEQSLAEVERKDPAGRLGAVFYAMEDLTKEVGGESGGKAPPMPLGDVGDAGGGDSARAVSQREPRGNDVAKAEVNTRSPLEGAEFRAGVERRPDPVDELEPTSQLRGGPPQAVLPVPPRDQAFEAGRVYRVLTHTNVVSAPSFGGRVIGELAQGDKVLVEGKLGRWLRLRSRQGRGGYVLASDVEEVGASDGG